MPSSKMSDFHLAMRRETTVQIRKQKRSSVLSKRRGATATTSAPPSTEAPRLVAELRAVLTEAKAAAKAGTSTPEQQRAHQQQATTILISIRDMLQAVADLGSVVHQLLQEKAVPVLIAFLSSTDAPALQALAASVFAIMAAVDEAPEAKAAAEAGASRVTPVAVQLTLETGLIPLLVTIFAKSPSSAAREGAAWCLGNLASDASGAPIRAAMLTNESLLGQLTAVATTFAPGDVGVRRQAVFALANLCRGADLEPAVIGHVVSELIRALSLILSHAVPATVATGEAVAVPTATAANPGAAGAAGAEVACAEDGQVLLDACHGLHLLSRSSDDQILTLMLQLGAVEALAGLLINPPSSATPAAAAAAAAVLAPVTPNAAVLTAVVRVLGNVAAGTDEHTMAVLSAGGGAWIRKTIAFLRDDFERELRRETCWLLANVAAVGAGAAAMVAKPHGPSMLSTIVEALEEAPWDVRREAVFVTSNLLRSLKPSGVRLFVDYSVLNPLCTALDVDDADCVAAALQAVEAVLKVSESDESCSYLNRLVDEAGGVEKLLNLQAHPNEAIYGAALALLESYFTEEQEEEQSLSQTQTQTQAQTNVFETSVATDADAMAVSAGKSQSLNMSSMNMSGLNQMGDSTNSMNVSGNTPLDEVRAGLNFNDADDHEDIQLKPGMIQPPAARQAGDENFHPN